MGATVRRLDGDRRGPATTDPRALRPHELAALDQALPHTMTSAERLLAVGDAVEHVVRRGISGDLVECGVWRGGSVLMMLLRLQHLGVDDRDVWLFDTFEGMTAPTAHDTSPFDEPALTTWDRARRRGERAWRHFFGTEVFGVDSVRELLAATGYPPDRLHFVAGAVEGTLPATSRGGVALLRLDTDWYASTRHELVHLYPRVATGGILIVDDYGHWDGSRRAVDEYFAEHPPAPFLSRIDYTGRIGVKP